ncbi:MAG: membrane protein insertase YidC [Treponema sp.]|jgi:YidC/Oxa1 family membrane protein insertase|nr:membrane protein insertase YidC [Treponema sp.]
MEKNTILAIVLSSIVLIVAFSIQSFLAPVPQQVQTQEPSQVTAVDTTITLPSETGITAPAVPEERTFSELETIPLQPPIIIDTELFTAVLTNAGGDMVSMKWKDTRKDPGAPDANVDLILSGNNEARAFSIAFGGLDAQPVSSNFHVNRISDYSVEFYRDFTAPSPIYGSDGRFRLTKRYDFKLNDYMFEMTIIMDGGFSVFGFDFSGSAYTLSFGPQIGPVFEKLDGYYDYRHYNIYTNGKRKDAKVNELINNSTWAAISGKYFAFIAVPYLNLTQYAVSFSDKAEPGLLASSRFNIIRSASAVSKIEDTYRFYLGPKTQEALGIYNTGRNVFGIQDANFNEIANTRGFWGIFSPLERVLKWLLLGIHRIIPNYGIAIILLTLLIKLLFFPLTKKGSEATLRMQALAPKIKELQEKYKSDPQKLRTEMGKFYQQEGYNPLSGCLPMLLQLPIFISMFSLFNNHFDLRGAMFIPGWIPDLSLPEYIVQFGDFRLPILGWTALRLLPFIYVGSQLLYGKVTQMPGQQSNTQMKLMLFVMPIVFFFILYDVPSGLLIYWIFSNLLTLVQQVIINKFIIAKKAALAQTQAQVQPEKQPVLPPKNSGGGKKKKKKS